jgi:hypothetical protein
VADKNGIIDFFRVHYRGHVLAKGLLGIAFLCLPDAPYPPKSKAITLYFLAKYGICLYQTARLPHQP